MKDLSLKIEEYYDTYSSLYGDVIKEISHFISEHGKNGKLYFDADVYPDIDCNLLVETDRKHCSYTWEYMRALQAKDGDVYVEAGDKWENVMHLYNDGILSIYDTLKYLESNENDDYIIVDGIVKCKEE